MGLTLCILLLVSLVNSGVCEVGLEVWVFAELQCRQNADAAAFNPLNNYFLSDPFKTSSVYYMHLDAFSNCFVMSSF